MTKIWLLVSLVLAAPLLADEPPGSLSTYVLRRFPHTSMENCRQEAELVGAKLEKEKGVVLYAAVCVRGEFGGIDAKISYFSEPPLRLVSTDWGYGVQGFFRTRGDCESDLPRQKEIFQKATGIDPFFAYCMGEETSGALTFAPRVDGFGNTMVRPRFFEGYITGRPVEVPANLQNRIQRSIAKSADPVVSDFVLTSTDRTSSTSSTYMFRARYYSRRDAPWYLVKADLEFQSVKECQVQTDELETSLKGAGIENLVTFCSWDGLLFRAQSNAFLTRIGSWYSVDTLPETFEDVQSCLATRPKAISFYTEKLKKKVIGALCSLDRKAGFPVRHKMRVLVPCRSAIDPLCHRMPEFP